MTDPLEFPAAGPPPFTRLAIAGLGLIGGSLALAVRRAWPDADVVGIDTRADVLGIARQLGAIARGSADIAAVEGADLVVLAAPVSVNLALLDALPRHLPGPAVVTDTGSTKRGILEAAARLPAHLPFVGGHPLAGAARGGFESSRADLFERRPWVLTPVADASADAHARVRSLLRAIGAVPLDVPAAEHDRILAYTSHLPQLAASALMHVVGQAVGESGLRLAGTGLADTTRVAASPADIWRDICAANADEIGPALDALLEALADLRRRVADGAPVDPLFASANRWRRGLRL